MNLKDNIMKNDKVLNAFNDASDKYDNYRKQAIPNMDLFYESAINQTTDYINPKILDLGAGTGILTQLLINKHPESEITLIDFSEEMLDKAKNKFKDNPNITYIKDDYLSHSYENSYDIIISSLSIHHLEDDEKQRLYQKIYDQLNVGGIFINADLILGNTPNTEELFKSIDEAHLLKQDMPDTQKDVLRQRRKLDKPATYADNIDFLKKAGFVDVEIIYKYYRYTVISANKN